MEGVGLKKEGLVNFANKVSITRILLVPVFVASIVYYETSAGWKAYLPFVIFFVAAISDALDGFIARKFQQQTELGTILDPLADKLLIITGFICLVFLKNIPDNLRIPAWVVLVVISRDIIIVLGTVVIHLMKGNIPVIPTIFGKVTTFFQMSTILAVLIKFQYSFILWGLAGFFTIISGIDYVRRGSRLLNGTHG